MVKIVFLGAGSVVLFRKNFIIDCMLCDNLHNAEFVLYDIDSKKLEVAETVVHLFNKSINNNAAVIKSYCGAEKRKEALRDADFVINTIQVGGYQPCTIIDFEIPKKYGLRQTIGDTVGIGGIFRALRTIPVLKEIAADIEAVCPNALLLDYTNPLAMITGFWLRYTNVKAIGLCHSAYWCSQDLLQQLGMKVNGFTDKIAGINHMAWLLEIHDLAGNDLYPEIKRLAKLKNQTKHNNMVRMDYIENLGYYCTETSEHNAEYSMFYIKSKYPELLEEYNIPLDVYPKKYVREVEDWDEKRKDILAEKTISYERSNGYVSKIIEAIITNTPYKFYGNVINGDLITNLPSKACVEVPCCVDGQGIHPATIGELPIQLAAMNITNINVQLLTIEAAVTGKREHIYQAAMFDPHTASELSIDEIKKLCDEMIEEHKKVGFWHY